MDNIEKELLEQIEKVRKKVCGDGKDNVCVCKISFEVGQTNFIPIESTKVTCERRIL